MRERIRVAADGTPRDPARRSALLWIGRPIGVNQLGFGAIVPVAPLVASVFGAGGATIVLAIAPPTLTRPKSGRPAG